MGRYRKELTFEQHRWGYYQEVSIIDLKLKFWKEASTEKTDDEKLIDIGCGILTPMIDKREAQQLLEKATK